MIQYKKNKSWYDYYIKNLRPINSANASRYIRKNSHSKGRLDKIIIAMLQISSSHENKCQYVFTRGHLRNKKCNKPAVNNGTSGSDRYCKNCIRKKAVQTKLFF